MKKLCSLLIVTVILSACCKEGKDGMASIEGDVLHHEIPIPEAVIYIKYDTRQFPGSDPSQYDASVVADDSAHYKIEGLCKGDYYLWSAGFDSLGPYPVYGGIPIAIEKKDEQKKSNVPVVE